MNQMIIDTRDELCPKPIIMVKKAIKESSGETTLKIKTNNRTSLENLLRFLKDNNYLSDVVNYNDYWEITAIQNTESSSINDSIDISKYCNTSTPVDTPQNNTSVLVVKSKFMGQGDDDLGEVLIKGYFNALSESENPPGKIIFYNSGVFLSVADSPVIKSLIKLKEKNIDLLICGTCVDYYQLKEKINIGEISNMFTICEILNNTNKIIYL